YGISGRDRLFGGKSRDWMWGNGGGDVIRGGDGADVLRGHEGEDRLMGGADGLDGDLVQYADAKQGVVVDLGRGRARGEGKDKLVGIENASGTYEIDVMIGNGKKNFFFGLFGSDLLRGGGGSDCLSPGGDDNRIFGGPGFDYYEGEGSNLGAPHMGCWPTSYEGDSTRRGLRIDLAEGTASNRFESTTLQGIEGVFGTYDIDEITGNAESNFLYGGPSSDVIKGLAGNDELDGGTGYDNLEGGEGTDGCLNGEVLMSCE
ncbi:MAG: hypothetical protein M3198_02850, partial [Actinomycetota bacterium]|nr:hypothetical protein [Actinomycetota bacterium]